MCSKTRTKRRGFLFTMPLMLGMGIIIFSSMIAISQLFVTVGGPMVPDLLADMPTIFHYTDDGVRVPEYAPILTSDYTMENAQGEKISEAEFAEAFPALAMYGLMVKIAAGIFVILLMLAGLSYFFEEFNIVRQGTAYNIIAKMLILIPIYLVLPYLWDMTAILIESSSLYLIDPFGGDPRSRTSELWCLMGSVTCSIDGQTSVDPVKIFDDIGSFDHDSTLSQDSWNNALQNPFFGEGFVVDILLSLFKGFAIMFMTAMMFILSAIRVLLTEIIIVSFPLVSAVGLIPWINTARISDMFQQNLIGLSMAPIISALVLSVGMSTVDSQNLPPLRMWFQLLGVGFLAVFFPVMLSPMLANLSTKVGTMVSTSLTSASVAGSAGLRGMTRGLSQASGAMGGARMAMQAGGMAGSGMAGSMAGGGMAGGGSADTRFNSADMGSATSGASMPGGLSMADKLSIYGKAGAIGLLSGLGSGAISASTQSMGVPQAGVDTSRYMAGYGDQQVGNMIQQSSANSISSTAVSQMVDIDNTSLAQAGPLQVNNSTVMNPGSDLNAMTQNSDSFDAGQSLAGDPAARKEFIGMYGQNMGMGEMSPEVQEKFEHSMNEHINAHPTAAGRMFGNLKSTDSGGA